MIKHLIAAAAVALLTASAVSAHDANPSSTGTPDAKAAKITMVFDNPLPHVPGKSLKGVLVEYGPGGFSPAHMHAKSAFITATVLEGGIRSQVNDGPVKVYKAGESFTENPGDRHAVSANASTTAPARLLAVFVVDTNDKELTTPITAPITTPVTPPRP